MPIVTYGNRRLDAGEPGDKTRLDAGESVFFLRQLELIDAMTYEVKYPDLKARQLIPAIGGIPEAAHAYTYRQYDRVGIAKLIGNAADDLPMIEALGQEYTSQIKPIGDGYGYDVFEIQAAAMTGMPLDATRARFARYAAELEVDRIIATGKIQQANSTPTTVPGMLGLLNQTGTTPFTLGTKALGGTTWGTLAAPNASGDEVAADLMGIAANLYTATQQLWGSFRILMNPAQYEYAAQKRLGSVSDTTALAFAKSNSTHIENVFPWWQIPSGTIAAFPYDPIVLGCIVNQEYTVAAPQQRNLKYVVNGWTKTGGVVCRYPVALSIATGA